MSKEFESIKKALEQALDHAKGKPVKAVFHEFDPRDVKDTKKSNGSN